MTATASASIIDTLRDKRHLDARSARELGEWLAWLEIGGFAPASLDAYERTCADLLNAHPHKEMRDFTDGDLLALLQRYPADSRRIRKAHLSNWFKWGYRTRRVTANPVELLPVIKQGRQPVIDVFTETEQAALEGLPLPDGPLMSLILEAGLRKAEARFMRVRRLDFNTNMVIVKEGAKGSRDRLVPMVPRLRTVLSELVTLEGLNPDDYLWYDKPGGGFAKTVRRSKPIGATSFGTWWERCVNEAGVEYVKRDPKRGIKGRGNPHTARHTFATRWRSRNLEMDDLQKLLGHASVATTVDLYVHTTTADVATRMLSLLGAED